MNVQGSWKQGQRHDRHHRLVSDPDSAAGFANSQAPRQSDVGGSRALATVPSADQDVEMATVPLNAPEVRPLPPGNALPATSIIKHLPHFGQSSHIFLAPSASMSLGRITLSLLEHGAGWHDVFFMVHQCNLDHAGRSCLSAVQHSTLTVVAACCMGAIPCHSRAQHVIIGCFNSQGFLPGCCHTTISMAKLC